MERSESRTKAMRATKNRNNFDWENHIKAKTNTKASALMGELFNRHANQKRLGIRFVCIELLKHRAFKSDLLVGLAFLNFLFNPPRWPAMDCYSRLFQMFCIRSWLTKGAEKCAYGRLS